jgi:D-alanyl-D-alanine carboxypeptidase
VATLVAARPVQRDSTKPAKAKGTKAAKGTKGTKGTKAPAAATVTKTAKVELTWSGELKNKAKLQAVLDAHPADLKADVVEGGKVLTTADTTATFDVAASPASHKLKVVPKAAAPGDYFLPKSKTVKVDPDKTTKATITLPYNRSNSRFTERTWELAGIDTAKANNVKSATLFGRDVIGGLNDLVLPKVTAANNWFTTNVTPAEQKAARESIVSLAGRVKRTQSRGTYSNHSTGTAVDINPSDPSLQNWHVKKSDKRHARAMKVFNKVVSQPSVFDAFATTLGKLLFPGAGDLSAFKGFNVWTERDRDRLLAASKRFNDFFPDYLLRLVNDADPSRKPAPTAATVMALSKADLTALAGKATTAKQADTASQLTDIAEVWTEVRAWVGGYVYAGRRKGESEGMLRRDFEAAKAKDPKLTSKGELTGMIAIHPAIVKALTESGWSWMVDYRHDDEKDFMHFEDRAAERTLKS